MVITEMLDTTLRKAYEDNLFKPGLDQCMDIFRDVASALYATSMSLKNPSSQRCQLSQCAFEGHG